MSKHKNLRNTIFELLQIAGILAFVVFLIVYSKETVEAAKNGMTICVNAIIPSLFPFFILSTLIIETGMTQRLGLILERFMRPVFNVSGECAAAFALGFVGGYPIGAKTVISLYENGSCTKTEAERLLSFCNNSGPAFIFGVVGAGVFSSGKIGLLLYIAHTAASIIVGILFRFYKRRASRSERGAGRVTRTAPAPFTRVFANAVKSASITTVSICGFVIFFAVLTRVLFLSGALTAVSGIIGSLLGPIGITEELAEKLLTGVLELTAGVWTLRGEASITSSVAMAAFMLGWAGLSVHSQVLSFIGESGLSVKTYIAGKTMQAVLSTGIILVIMRFSKASVTAASLLVTQVSAIAQISFLKALTISLSSAFGVFAVILAAVWIAAARDMKNKKYLT